MNKPHIGGTPNKPGAGHLNFQLPSRLLNLRNEKVVARSSVGWNGHACTSFLLHEEQMYLPKPAMRTLASANKDIQNS